MIVQKNTPQAKDTAEKMYTLYQATQKWTPFSVMVLFVLLAILSYAGYDLVTLHMHPDWLPSFIGVFIGGAGSLAGVERVTNLHLAAQAQAAKENSTNG